MDNKVVQQIQQIHYYCKRLGSTTNLASIGKVQLNDFNDLELLLAELKELDKICIQEVE